MPPLSRKAKIVLVVIVAIAVLAIAGVGFAVWYLRAKQTAPPPSSGGSTANYDATSDTWSGTFKVAMTPAMAGAYPLYNWTESNTNPTGLTTVMTADDQSTNDAALFTGAVTPGDQLTTTNDVQCSSSQTPVPASFSTLTVDASSPCVVLGYLP